MNDFESTLNVCERYLISNPFVTSAFRKEEGSSSRGFLYNYEKDGFSVMVDMRVDEKLCHILMDVHAGVEIVDDESKVIRQMIYEYCQQYSEVDEPGFLCMSDRTNYVQYHISTPFVDGPISVETLDWMNESALEKLRKHTHNLQLLASGHLPEMLPSKKLETTDAKIFPQENLRKTVDALPEQLYNCKNNVVGRNILDNKQKLYMDQVLSVEFALYRELWVNYSGCLIIAIRTEFKVPKTYQRGELTVQANKINSTHEVSGLRVLNKDGYIWISTALSLWDGPISGETIELASNILMSVIARYYDDFANYAHGWPKKNCSEQDYSSYISRLEMIRALESESPSERNTFSPIPELEGEDSQKMFEDLFGHHPDRIDSEEGA